VSPPPNNVAADALRGKTASRPLGSQKTLASARLNLKPLGLMKVTLDHNCIIHLSNRTDVGKKIEATVHDKSNQCFVVNIGRCGNKECARISTRNLKSYLREPELLISRGSIP